MIDDLKSLYIFASVAECGSFRAASNHLDLSPSVVSYHISRLEDKYDMALLYRSTRKISLTSQGQELHSRVQSIIQAGEQSINWISGKSPGAAGNLCVSVPAAMSHGFLLNDLARFAKNNQQVSLDIRFDDQNVDLVGSGIDLAIRAGDLPDSNLKSRRIATQRRVLVATPVLLEERELPGQPADLADWDWVRLRQLPGHRDFTGPRGQRVRVQFETRVMVNNATALCQMVKQGVGLGTAPEFVLADELEAGNLVEVLPSWKLDPLQIWGIWPSHARRSSLTRMLLDHLVACQEKSTE